jgi:hypothetical protein
MPFDLGFNFRNTGGFVTDPAYAVPVLGETYPHTYTNGNGQSLNAGWDAIDLGQDRANTNDPRIAGANLISGAGGPCTFTCNLASGSAPGAGAYTVDLACGEQDISRTVDFKVFDSTTMLIDGTNGGAGFSPTTHHYIDATVTDVAATTTWTGTPVAKTFATTTVKFTMAIHSLSNYDAVAHFRLTLAGPSFKSAWAARSNVVMGAGRVG